MDTNSKERFFRKFEKSNNGCWEWISGIGNHGYGIFCYKHHPSLAHRISYQIRFGEIPKFMCVCHKCDNRICVNPDHLFLGTYKDNTQDMIRKGRQVLSSGNKSTKKMLWLIRNEQIKELRKQGFFYKEIRKIFNISEATAYRIANS